MQVIHHGGKHTVTGSCHELRVEDQAILIDCGLFQGADTRPLEVEFKTQHLNALLLTHSHIDHIGRIPWLLATGFNQPIICTKATAAIAPLMIEDGLKLQGFSHSQRKQILKRIHSLIQPQAYHQWLPIPRAPNHNKQKDHGRPSTLYARFQPAGHILGSAYIEVKLPNEEVVVFSGDLGPNNTPLLPDPVSPERADYLFIESTYGASNHSNIAERAETLNRIIDHSLEDGGAILIPAFSVGRTQELLFDIEQMIEQRSLSRQLPIILDSPMAY
ncbi:MBL fold metallo-hydrolase, partial [Vibrio fortis]